MGDASAGGSDGVLEWQQEADRLARQSLAVDDPTGWFEQLYGAADGGSVSMPWDRMAPHPLLAEWARSVRLVGVGRSAVVVGAGLGADAEFLTRNGFRTTAFDISDTAVRLARERYPGSTVDYRRADLFDLPADWLGAFELVVEIYTVQALPASLRLGATAAVRSLVATGGTLLAIYRARDLGEPVPIGPPWPLDRAEIGAFATGGLQETAIERLPDGFGGSEWRAEFCRTG